MPQLIDHSRVLHAGCLHLSLVIAPLSFLPSLPVFFPYHPIRDPPTDSLHRNNDGTVRDDVELKVTDICSTNPQDPTYCATPADIKIDRIKADLLFSSVTNKTAAENAALQGGTEYPGESVVVL